MSETRSPKEMAEAIIYATEQTNRLLGGIGADGIFEDAAIVARAMLDLQAKCDKLQAFKDYTHARLDAAGVSADPESSHKVEGCRIGGRLDEAFAVRGELLQACYAALVLIRKSQFAGGSVEEQISAAIAKAQPAPTLEDVCRGIGEGKMRGRGEQPREGG